MYSVLVNPAGMPTSHPADAPKETIPTWVQRSPAALPPAFCTRGPPESPLQDPRPPAVSMQTTPSPTMPYTALQSALVMTGMSLTSLRTGEMPPALSEGLPHPVTVTMEPTAGGSPVAGRQEAEMKSFMGRGLGSSTRARSPDRSLLFHRGWVQPLYEVTSTRLGSLDSLTLCAPAMTSK